jgi:hypothetical protein
VNRAPTPGRIVAALNFGFWTAMFGPDYEGLWRATLRRIAAKPDGTGLKRGFFGTTYADQDHTQPYRPP